MCVREAINSVGPVNSRGVSSDVSAIADEQRAKTSLTAAAAARFCVVESQNSCLESSIAMVEPPGAK